MKLTVFRTSLSLFLFFFAFKAFACFVIKKVLDALPCFLNSLLLLDHFLNVPGSILPFLFYRFRHFTFRVFRLSGRTSRWCSLFVRLFFLVHYFNDVILNLGQILSGFQFLLARFHAGFSLYGEFLIKSLNFDL